MDTTVLPKQQNLTYISTVRTLHAVKGVAEQIQKDGGRVPRGFVLLLCLDDDDNVFKDIDFASRNLQIFR